MTAARAHRPILIVGAGPVGMTAALALARWGVPSIVVEARDRASTEGSRSICVQQDVLDLFTRLGCPGFLAEGVSWTVGRTYHRSTELFQIRFPELGANAFPPFVNLPQSRTEELLLERVDATPLIDLRWSLRATGLRQDDEGVTLEVQGGSSDPAPAPAELHAPYLIGADGTRSTVRKLLGLPFEGHSHADLFLIADIRAKLPFPTERRFFFDPPFNPGRQVLVHPQPNDVWRIDWQVPPGTDVEEERRTGRLDERIRAVVGDADYELVWLSTYRFHQRRVDRMRVGRVFLAGDAAHVMSPFGARGMNSGVADAENLAWKLWLVVTGRAPQALLDTYDDERLAAAKENLRLTDETMRFMVPPTRLRRLRRNLILRGSPRFAALRRRVNSGRLATPFTYAGSPVIASDDPATAKAAAGLPAPGSLAPDGPCRLPGDAAVTRLRELCDRGFVGLYFPADVADAGLVAERAAAASPAPPATLYLVTRGQAPPGAPGGALPLVDVDGVLAGALGPGPGWFWLLRPDGHVAARRVGFDGSGFAELVTRAAGGPAPALRAAHRVEV